MRKAEGLGVEEVRKGGGWGGRGEKEKKLIRTVSNIRANKAAYCNERLDVLSLSISSRA